MQPDQLAQLQQFSAMLNNSPSNSIRRGGSQSQVQPAPPTMGLNRGLSEKFGDKLTESKRVCGNLLAHLIFYYLFAHSLTYSLIRLCAH